MGLEPTTIPVTGEYSDQLNYYRIIFGCNRQDSNLRSLPETGVFKPSKLLLHLILLARLTGLEPVVFPVTGEYFYQLNYNRIWWFV